MYIVTRHAGRGPDPGKFLILTNKMAKFPDLTPFWVWKLLKMPWALPWKIFCRRLWLLLPVPAGDIVFGLSVCPTCHLVALGCTTLLRFQTRETKLMIWQICYTHDSVLLPFALVVCSLYYFATLQVIFMQKVLKYPTVCLVVGNSWLTYALLL